VDDNWLATFNDKQLNALVAEAISVQNPNMRILSAQVDRAEASTRLAAAAKKPMVGVYGLATYTISLNPDPYQQG
jgi:outer membrane protein TolC